MIGPIISDRNTMQELEFDIKTTDGDMNTFAVWPDENGPFPVILFLMDAPGKREELHDMARRLATSGYFVLLPNLYYRTSRDFVMADRNSMVEQMDSLNNRLVLSDCDAMLDWADNHPDTHSGPAGVIGYCMSGPFAFYAVGQRNNKIHAGASIHGIRLITEQDDSPHLSAPQIHGEFYIGCAETDHWAPPEMIDRLQNFLAAEQAPVRIEWYPQTEHGFVFPDRAEKYHKASAEKHWQRILAMFDRQLKRQT